MGEKKTTVKKMSQGYGYTYSDLSTIHEELEKQGITYYQFIYYDQAADADYIFTVIKYGEKEMEPRRGCRVVSGGDSMKSAAQAQGSALTYARRYSLLLALGWATEDDDGASAGAPSAKPRRMANKLDFNQVRERLSGINTEEELNAYWRSLNLSEKQAEILKGDFAKRKASFGVGVGE